MILIFVLAAFLTPPEPVTQFLMAVPMVVLFFTSVLVAFILNPEGRNDPDLVGEDEESEHDDAQD